MVDEALLYQAADLLRGARQVAVLTGAGVSKESGVPTFRDALEGLWEKFDPQELATPAAFQRSPRTVWQWYAYRREMLKQAQPNPGHLALAQLEQRFHGMRLITQNVDDLHERAGSQHVIHLHGNIARSKCSEDCLGAPTIIDLETLDDDEVPPRCPHCGAYLRPDVVWFTEMLPQDAYQDARSAAQHCDVMMVIGTSGLVSPAADLPALARAHGAKLIEINPDETPITPLAAVKLRGPSGEMLPRLVALLAENG
jgi:NAD-dependent deacetylase